MNLNTNDYKIITTTWRLYVENGLVREQKTRKKKKEGKKVVKTNLDYEPSITEKE